MALTLNIPAFANGAAIPVRHTCDGADESPALTWADIPPGVKSFALIVEDPDAPAGTWNHWLLWDVPGSAKGLSQGYEPGSTGVSGRNDFGRRGYGGPCPPSGHGRHRYFFRLFALDRETLGLSEGSSRRGLDNALAGHIMAAAEYLGVYERKKK